MFWKKRSRAMWIYIQKRMLQMSKICEWSKILPQNSIFLELSPPGMLLPGDPGEVKRYEWNVWTAAGFLWQQVDLYTKTILVPWRCWTFKNYTMVLRDLPPSRICAICMYFKGTNVVSQNFRQLTIMRCSRGSFTKIGVVGKSLINSWTSSKNFKQQNR